jgi:Peptidase family M1 domain
MQHDLNQNLLFCGMKFFGFLIFLFCATTVFAQPGWQQRVDTKIDVKLDDKNHFLYANEEITYYNNSPDSLTYIIIHLWPNAYKHDHTPYAQQLDRNGKTDFYYSKAAEKGYIDSLQFTVDGYTADFTTTDDAPDVAKLILPHALKSGHKIVISTPFRVKIPKVFSRMGHNGQAYFISQWFPKPAVYDQKGWHPLSYLENGEFFSEYGSYDVYVHIPENYVVMGTGNILNNSEINWLDSLADAPMPSDTLYKKSFPPSAAKMKTVKFHEDNVHDFAWFADKRWVVRKDTVVCPGNNNTVTTWTAFLPSYQKQWKYGTDYLKETIKHYGKWVGPYPYKTIKAVLGDMKAGGGMEYPTVTIIDKAASSSLKTVIVHEAGHNWFYGLLGSNERDHAWMDEGLNTFFEQKTSKDIIDSVLKKKYAANTDTATNKKKKKKSGGFSLTIGAGINENLIYDEFASIHNDMAIDQTSANFPSINYGVDVYYKTALMLNWLEKFMGPEDFHKGITHYFETWCYHHPYPEDFMQCMQQATPSNINWFFSPGLISKKPVDFRIFDAKIEGDTTVVTVKNKTGILAPARIDACINDSVVTAVWTPAFKKTTRVKIASKDWTKLKIDAAVPDFKRSNETYRRGALLPTFSFEAKPFVGVNTGTKDKLFYLPAVGFNDYDGIMAGAVLHDITFPENRFRFILVPMYGFNSKTFVGACSAGYIWYTDQLFKEVLIQVDGKTFHSYNDGTTTLAYTKIAPSLNLTFNEHNALSTVTRTFNMKWYKITEQYQDAGEIRDAQSNFATFNYNHRNRRTYNPFGYSLGGQIGTDFAKLSAEGNITINYNRPNKSLYVRAYAGKYFATNSDVDVAGRYGLNAAYGGVNDYLYDGTYVARTSQSGWGGRQVSLQEGGFKIPVFDSVNKSNDYLAAINLKTDLPLKKLPVRLFFDAGIIPNNNTTASNSSSTTIIYDGGIEIGLINHTINIYVPLIMSTDFSNFMTNKYGSSNVIPHSISFSFDLQDYNWLKSPIKSLKLN